MTEYETQLGMLKQEIARLHQENDRLRQRVTELEAVFDARWAAQMRAVELWQSRHPGKDLTWPDHADLVVWLLEELEKRSKADA